MRTFSLSIPNSHSEMAFITRKALYIPDDIFKNILAYAGPTAEQRAKKVERRARKQHAKVTKVINNRRPELRCFIEEAEDAGAWFLYLPDYVDFGRNDGEIVEDSCFWLFDHLEQYL